MARPDPANTSRLRPTIWDRGPRCSIDTAHCRPAVPGQQVKKSFDARVGGSPIRVWIPHHVGESGDGIACIAREQKSRDRRNYISVRGLAGIGINPPSDDIYALHRLSCVAMGIGEIDRSMNSCGGGGEDLL